jgi:7-cyano-7-deazaguanine tRNA-ribosyltransferase
MKPHQLTGSHSPPPSDGATSLLFTPGLSLKQLQPRVWDNTSPYYLSQLSALMLSYADFHQQPAARRRAMQVGLREFVGAGPGIKIYLDNGSFYFLARDGKTPRKDYEEFVAAARPDWWPIPRDFIPTPQMSRSEQRRCFTRTMRMNLAYQHDGYTPVMHVGQFLEQYTRTILAHEPLAAKTTFALGGIVPNLLRAPKAMPYKHLLENLHHTRLSLASKHLHVFGIGGTATLHVAALVGIDSVDSSGWRNRAARGIVQLPGSGDRVVANLGKWRGREPSRQEWGTLRSCACPACQRFGLAGQRASGTHGFSCRATHNLWTLLQEAQLIEQHLTAGTYGHWYAGHLDNSIYRPLIEQALAFRSSEEERPNRIAP